MPRTCATCAFWACLYRRDRDRRRRCDLWQPEPWTARRWARDKWRAKEER
jgi:hypothetical protein